MLKPWRSKSRTVHVSRPDKSLEYEKLANKLAPLIVYKRFTPEGASTVGIVGRYLIVKPGAGSPFRGMKVAVTLENGGTTMNMDWFDAVERAQEQAVRLHNRHKKMEADAQAIKQRERNSAKSRKARSKRVRQSRRRGRR